MTSNRVLAVIVFLLVTVPFLDNYLHALDGEPEPISASDIEAGHRPKSHFVLLSGVALGDHRARIGGRSTSEYVPLVSSRWTPGKPVRLLAHLRQLTPEERDGFTGPRTFPALVRNVLWEGLWAGTRAEIAASARVDLHEDVLLVEPYYTPRMALLRGLVVPGVYLSLLLVFWVNSRRKKGATST